MREQIALFHSARPFFRTIPRAVEYENDPARPDIDNTAFDQLSMRIVQTVRDTQQGCGTTQGAAFPAGQCGKAGVAARGPGLAVIAGQQGDKRTIRIAF